MRTIFAEYNPHRNSIDVYTLSLIHIFPPCSPYSAFRQTNHAMLFTVPSVTVALLHRFCAVTHSQPFLFLWLWI